MMSMTQKIAYLEDQNEHSAAAVLHAEWLTATKPTALSNAYMTVLVEIKDRHELNGHIDHNDREMRDSIVQDIRKTLKLLGEL